MNTIPKITSINREAKWFNILYSPKELSLELPISVLPEGLETSDEVDFSITISHTGFFVGFITDIYDSHSIVEYNAVENGIDNLLNIEIDTSLISLDKISSKEIRFDLNVSHHTKNNNPPVAIFKNEPSTKKIDTLESLVKYGYFIFEDKTLPLKNPENYIRSLRLQRNVTSDFKSSNICATNGKLLINMEVSIFSKKGNNDSISFSVSIRHEFNEVWSDLSIYSISEKRFTNVSIEEWENKIISLWDTFCLVNDNPEEL